MCLCFSFISVHAARFGQQVHSLVLSEYTDSEESGDKDSQSSKVNRNSHIKSSRFPCNITFLKIISLEKHPFTNKTLHLHLDILLLKMVWCWQSDWTQNT